MIERAYIHVGGPPGSGKTTLIEAILRRCGHLVCVARCVRDDSLPAARESYPKSHPELHRYRRAGGIGRALFEFPKRGTEPDAFFTTGLLEGYSQAVIVEGDSPLDHMDLEVFVAPPLEPGEELFVRRTVDLAEAERALATSMEELLDQPDEGASSMEEMVGFPVGSLMAREPDGGRELMTLFRRRLEAARNAPPRLVERWSIDARLRDIEKARLVVVNIRGEEEREGAERLLTEVAKLREQEAVYKDILGRRGRAITAVVADISDLKDAGLKKALAKVRRSMVRTLI